MNFIFDIFLVLLMILFIFINTKRGFVRSTWPTVISIGSFSIAYSYGASLGKHLFFDFFHASFTNYAYSILNGMLNKAKESHYFSELITSFQNEFLALVDNCGSNAEILQKQFSTVPISQEELYNLAKSIVSPVSQTISKAVGIIVLFLLSVIVLAILGFAFKFITKLPVVRAIDKILGFLLGFIEGAVVVIILCIITAVFIECGFLNNVLGSYFESLTDNSIIFRLFCAISPIDFINIG